MLGLLAGWPLCALSQASSHVVATAKQGGPFRFKSWQLESGASVGAKLLTQEERAFVDQLPVVRVGMAVPDWPTTFGYNMFRFPLSRMVGGAKPSAAEQRATAA